MYDSENRKMLAAQTHAGFADSTASRDRAPIDMALSHLQDRIENLRRLISGVEGRFAPACRQAPPQGPTGTPSAPQPALSPVGSLVNEYAAALRDLEIRLELLLSNCEL